MPRTIKPGIVGLRFWIITCAEVGVLVPMPIRPEASTRMRSVPSVLKMIESELRAPRLRSALLFTEGVRTPLSAVSRPVTRSVLLTCEAPATVSVLPSVVAPLTPSVLLSVVAPETPSVLLSVVAPETPSVLLSVAAPVARKVPATSKTFVGLLLPIPTLPPLAIRSRSAPLVLAVMTLAPPAASDSVPASAVRPSEVVPLTVGVRTPPVAVVRPVTPSVPATVASPVAASVVKRPVLAVVAPIEVLLIVPPPIATLLVWNCPAAVMTARTTLLVTSCRFWLLVAPKKLPVGAAPRVAADEVIGLPLRLQAFAVTSAEVEICDSTPVLLAMTMRSSPAGMVVAAVPPKLLSVVTPVTPKVLESVVAPVTPKVLPNVAAPTARKLPFTSRRSCGSSVPIPTLPLLSRRRRSAPLVLKATSLVAGRYMPLPAAVPPVGMNLAAVAVPAPVTARFVPSKVSAPPVVSTRLPLRKATPFAVPPFKVTLPEAVSVDTVVAPETANELLSVVEPLTPSVPLIEVLPALSAPSVEAPVTFSVPPKTPLPEAVSAVVLTPPFAATRPVKMEVPPTARLPLSVVAPPTTSAPLSALSTRTRRPPFTSSIAVGAVVLMPTKPALAPVPRMRMRSALLVRMARSAASRVPTKLLVGLVPVLPVIAQAVAPTSVAVETCDSSPAESDITTRSSPVRSVRAAPPSEATVALPVTPRLPPKLPLPEALRLVVLMPPAAVSRPVTPSVLLICETPPTVKALASVVAPVTLRVLLRVEAPATVSVSPRVVAPVTPSVPPKLPVPLATRLVVLMPPLAVTNPVTPKVLLIVEAPATVSVLPRTVSPPTVSAPPTSAAPVTPKEPVRSRVRTGIMPIPTRPF